MLTMNRYFVVIGIFPPDPSFCAGRRVAPSRLIQVHLRRVNHDGQLPSHGSRSGPISCVRLQMFSSANTDEPPWPTTQVPVARALTESTVEALLVMTIL